MSNTQMFVGGAFVDTAQKKTVDVVNPATGVVVGSGVVATIDDVNTLVGAASEALVSWSQSTPDERSAALGRLAAAWDARSGELAAAVSREMGMPISYSGIFNGFLPGATFGYYSAIAANVVRESTQEALLSLIHI